MGALSESRRQIYYCMFGVFAVLGFGLSAAAAHQCSHGHHNHHHHVDDEDVGLVEKNHGQQTLLPEEMAEEEDLKMMWGHDDHVHVHVHHEHDGDVDLSGLGLWIKAMGCSLLVSLASLICLVLLPIIFTQGKPSKAVVDSLALFGAGAMLGDAFLHQLPHAFGGDHSHSHDHGDDHHHEQSHSHSHSLKDLSVGLSILAGIVVFLIVEKLVRYVEEYSGGVNDWSTGHHHHHKHSDKLKEDDAVHQNHNSQSHDEKSSGGKKLDKPVDNARSGTSEKDSMRKHNFTDGMALGSAFLLYGSVGGWSRTLFLLAH